MYPHERSLVKRLEGQPFALIGVNSDRDREALKAVLATHVNAKLPWSCGNRKCVNGCGGS